MIELQDIAKSYAGAAALRGIDLRIPPSSTTVLLGPSGCGKSTILRLIMGLVPPDRGRVVVDGEEVSARSTLSLRRRMGYVIQDGGLFPHLTARGNVVLAARQFGWSAERIATRVSKLVELARFPSEALERYPAQLSGGQQQRVSLMRALMLDPDVLLLDEPLGALDPLIRADLQEELRGIFRELRKTVVLVTHDLAEAAYLGDRLVLLAEGRVVQEGTLDSLLRSPSDPFVTRFVQAQRSAVELGEDGR